MSEEVKITIKVGGASQAKAELDKTRNAFKSFASDIGKEMGITKSTALGTVFGMGIYNGISASLNLGVNAVRSFTGTVGNILQQSLFKASNLQDTALAFEVMLGSAEKAKTLLTDLSQFAKVTPFNLGELQGLTKQMLAYGFTQDDVIKQMEILGNLSAGVGKDKLPQLTLAYGQVKAATKLTGAELRQFSEAGVPLLQALADEFGVTTARVQEMISEGIVGFPDVERALSKLTGEGGRFNDMMKRQSGTFSGVMSNLEDFRDGIFRTIGGIKDNGEIIKGGLLDVLSQQVTKLQKGLEENRPAIEAFFGSVSKGLGDFITSGINELIKNGPGIKRFFTEEFLPGAKEVGTWFVENADDMVRTAGDIGQAMFKMGELAAEGIRQVKEVYEDAKNIGIGVGNFIVNEMGGGPQSNAEKLMEVKALIDAAAISQADLNLLSTEYKDNLIQTSASGAQAFERIRKSISDVKSNVSATKPELEKLDYGIQKGVQRMNDMNRAANGAKGRIQELGGVSGSVLSSIINMADRAIFSISQIGARIGVAKSASAGLGRYATGGVVPGNSYQGDKVLARVNSGEMILNRQQQAQLFAALNRPNTTNNFGNVNFGGGNMGQMQQMNTFSQLLAGI